LGREGEAAVRAKFDIGPTSSITTASGKTRYPDGINVMMVSEVKNVAYQGYTRQLKDYVARAQSIEGAVTLYVRPGARLSKPLWKAINDPEVPIFLDYIRLSGG
jgi:hypothetical protein